MHIKKLISLILCLLLMITIVGCGGQPANQDESQDSQDTQEEPTTGNKPKILAIGTAGMGGTYYPVGVGLGNIIEKYIPDVSVSVELTGGTMENPPLVAQDELELAIANEHLALFALEGRAPFDNLKSNNVAALAGGLNKGILHYATMANSGIETPEDLKGKRIAVGPQGNGSIPVIQDVLAFYGIEWNEITPTYLNYSEGMQALIDGTVDCAIAQAGLPTPAIVELAAGNHDYKILNFPNRDKLLEEYPYYVPADIPAGTYDGQDEDLEVIATQNMFIVNSNLDEELVYEITKALFEHIDELYAAHASAECLTLEVAPKTVVPLHPGAARYYMEQGVLN